MSVSQPSAWSRALVALRRMADRARMARQRARQRIELHGMSERELNDLGIGRSEVPQWSRRHMPAMCTGGASADRSAVSRCR